MPERSGPRSRGVRLSDLDRGHLYVIGFTGRRWETLGILTDPAAVAPLPDGVGASAGAGGASTAPAPRGRHTAPGPAGDPWHPPASWEPRPPGGSSQPVDELEDQGE